MPRGQQQKRKVDFDQLKAGINLSEFVAAKCGYTKNHKKSSPAQCVMERGKKRIVVSVSKENGHYIYWNPNDDQDNGSIIEFYWKEFGGGWKDLFNDLLPWIGNHNFPLPDPATYSKTIRPTEKNIAGVQLRYAKFKTLESHPYLETTRLLPRAVLLSPRFHDTIKVDQNGYAVFPHYNGEGELTGYEIKTTPKPKFSKGGEKGLWSSNEFPDDTTLVLTEAAIDGISYHCLEPDEHTRYKAFNGQMNDSTLR